MALYQLGTPVYVRSCRCAGVIAEANYQGGRTRRATYLVAFPSGGDDLTGSRDLVRLPEPLVAPGQAS